MPAVSTTPPTEMSLAAMILAVSRQVTNSAANVTNRQLIMRGCASYVRQDGRRLLAERPLQREGQLGVALVRHREDPALRDLARQILQDLGERLLGDALGGGVVHVDLPITHLQGIQRPRILQRHLDPDGSVVRRGGKEGAHPPLDRLDVQETLALAGFELIEYRLARHPPLQLPVQDVAPLRPERPPVRVLRVVPVPDVL